MKTARVQLPNPAGWLVWLFFAAALLLQLPGNVPYDGIVVWHEAETRQLYAQHPAAQVLVWWLTERLMHGPALFTALQLAALWSAAAILLARWCPPFWATAVFLCVLLLWPPLLAMSGLTVKDVFGAHLCLLAFALALPRRERVHRPVLWLIAFALGTLAALFRYQLVLILPVLAIELLWDVRRFRAQGAVAVGMAVLGMAAAIGLVALSVSAVFVAQGTGDVNQSLRKIMVYDIAGVVVHRPSTPLADFAADGVDVGALKTQILRNYSPVRVDTLWQENGEGSALLAPRGAFALLTRVPDRILRRQWEHTAAADPAGLLKHRVATFARVLGFGDLYACRPIRPGISWLPPSQATAVHAAIYRPAPSAGIMKSRWFPAGLLFRSWFYAAIGVVVVIGAWLGAPREAVLLALFALIYEASFFFLPQACEVRYSYPEMLAVIVAVALWVWQRAKHAPLAAAGMVGADGGTG